MHQSWKCASSSQPLNLYLFMNLKQLAKVSPLLFCSPMHGFNPLERWSLMILSLDFIFSQISRAKTCLATAMSRPGIAVRAMTLEKLEKTMPAKVPVASITPTRTTNPASCDHTTEEGKSTTVIYSGGWGRSLNCTQCRSRWLSVENQLTGKPMWEWWSRDLKAVELRAKLKRDSEWAANIDHERSRLPPRRGDRSEASLPQCYSQSQPSPIPAGKARPSTNAPTPLWKIAAGLNLRSETQSRMPPSFSPPTEMGELGEYRNYPPNERAWCADMDWRIRIQREAEEKRIHNKEREDILTAQRASLGLEHVPVPPAPPIREAARPGHTAWLSPPEQAACPIHAMDEEDADWEALHDRPP